VQGCSRHCSGCHNQQTWDVNGGELRTVDDVADELNKYNYCDGLTITGGEPMEQEEALLELLSKIKFRNVWLYTGYTLAEIRHRPILRKIDVLVDGPFVESLKCEGRLYGSSNQTIHLIKDIEDLIGE
jgi:anaerobic ribonucleoside-triphosphate reductase activating protein